LTVTDIYILTFKFLDRRAEDKEFRNISRI